MDGIRTTTTGRERNRRGEGDRLRAEILDAALHLLEQGQESAVTLRSVARRVGVSAPSIYRHFPDRDAIMHAIVVSAFAEVEQTLRRTLTADPVARVRGLSAAYLDFAQTHPHRYRLMFGGVWNAEDALMSSTSGLTEAELRTLGTGAYQLLVDAIGACVAAGRSSAPDPAAAAAALWAALHGLAQLRPATPLFPWSADIEDDLVTGLARLETPP